MLSEVNFPQLETEILLQYHRTLLKPFDNPERVFTELSKIAYIPGIWLYSPGGAMTEQRLKTYIQTAFEEKENGLSYPFLTFDKKANQIAGSTRYMNIVAEHKRLEIGHTWLAPDYQGTGLN